MTPPDLPDRPGPLDANLFDRVGRTTGLWLGPEAQAPALGIRVLGTPEDSPLQVNPVDPYSSDAPDAEPLVRSTGSEVKPLELAELLTAVERHFPVVLAARAEVDLAAARLLGARGAFDTQLGASARKDFEGFYQNERYDVSLSQPTRLGGAKFFGGYRLGSGEFDFYDQGGETNHGGEFSLGLGVPLLQGRAIDKSRVAEWRALLDAERAEPVVEAERIDATLDAARAYWDWIAAGAGLEITRLLLSLAETRQRQIELAAEAGELAPIATTDNERLIVERRIRFVRATRELEKAAIVLSLYLRNEEGEPVVPSPDRLPPRFPLPSDPAQVLIENDIVLALERRPDLRAIDLEVARAELDRDLAENAMLPVLDLKLQGSQDLGGATSTPDDKDPFELKAGLTFGVPVQRRVPRGKLREQEMKLVQLRLKAQFAREKAVAEVQDSVSAVTQSWQRVGEAARNVRLAAVLADAERVLLAEGESDLFRVNLREQQAALAQAAEVQVLSEHFRSLARYRAVLGLPYDELLGNVAP